MEIDNGIEVKVKYVRNQKTLVIMVFSTKAIGSESISAELWDGNCKFTFTSCDHGTYQLTMPMIQDGVTFTMKIYRGEKKIMIDIDEENKVELDTISSSPPRCAEFWGEGEINKVYFALAAGRNAATHYRILGEDNEDDDAGGLI